MLPILYCGFYCKSVAAQDQRRITAALGQLIDHRVFPAILQRQQSNSTAFPNTAAEKGKI